MKSKSKLVFLKYRECSQIVVGFRVGKAQECPNSRVAKYIDHNSLILTDFSGCYGFEHHINRITFYNDKWYYSIEPRVECDQSPLIRMANLARNHAIQFEDNVREFYWLRASYKMEGIYR